MLIGDFDDVVAALFFAVGQRKGHRLLGILPVASWEVRIEQNSPARRQYAQMDVGLHTERVIEGVDGIELYRTDLLTIFILHADTIRFLRVGWLQRETGVWLATEKLLPLFLILLCLDLFHLTECSCIAFGSGESKHSDILPVTPIIFMRNWQLDIEFAATSYVSP